MALAAALKVHTIWFVNTVSGGRKGVALKSLLKRRFGTRVVADLARDGEAQDVLRAFTPLINEKEHICCVVCGGDGTVGWVLQHINDSKELRLENLPIAIFPLGTGNDLSRALGWGGGILKNIDDDFLIEYLMELEAATPERIDQWHAHVDTNVFRYLNSNNEFMRGRNKLSQSKDALPMAGYFGLGIDAQIAMEFDAQRRRTPNYFSSQLTNKGWYAFFGGRNLLRSVMNNSPRRSLSKNALGGFSTQSASLQSLSILLDGERLAKIPSTAQGLIFLNINSFMGGGRMWDVAQKRGDGLWWSKYQSCTTASTLSCTNISDSADGLINIFAVDGSIHLGRILLGMSRPHRVGQAAFVEIASAGAWPIQIDGEPRYLQGPWSLHLEVSEEPAIFLRNSRDYCSSITRHGLASHLIQLYNAEKDLM